MAKPDFSSFANRSALQIGQETAAALDRKKYNGRPSTVNKLDFPDKRSRNYAASFSGTDVTGYAFFDEPGLEVPLELAAVQTITISGAVSSTPVLGLGRKAPYGYSVGDRTCAGSIVFSHIYLDPIYEFMLYLQKRSVSINIDDYMHYSDLPPFSILLNSQAEVGTISDDGKHSYPGVNQVKLIFGVQLLNTGSVVSVDDMLTEHQYSYVAMADTPWFPCDNTRISIMLNNLRNRFVKASPELPSSVRTDWSAMDFSGFVPSHAGMIDRAEAQLLLQASEPNDVKLSPLSRTPTTKNRPSPFDALAREKKHAEYAGAAAAMASAKAALEDQEEFIQNTLLVVDTMPELEKLHVRQALAAAKADFDKVMSGATAGTQDDLSNVLASASGRAALLMDKGVTVMRRMQGGRKVYKTYNTRWDYLQGKKSDALGQLANAQGAASEQAKTDAKAAGLAGQPSATSSSNLQAPSDMSDSGSLDRLSNPQGSW